ncbi:hypothetical protein ATCC90586_001018 [Pythium insidiosum]|nr:hypothetical protein ATCC90586_001018 [Pythium insidiosum]
MSKTSSSDYVAVATPVARLENRLDAGFDKVDDAAVTAATAAASKQETNENGKLLPLPELFRYADTTDCMLMGIGTLGALAAGLSQPVQIILFGDMVNSFNPSVPPQPGQFRDDINKIARNFAIVGAAVVVCCFIQVATWSVTASRQAKRIRSAYVSSILNKEIGWFDVNEPMQLSTRVADSTVTIQEGMGRKATSALDTESERIVQESLDKLLASSNRTTIIVAHRLSTIRNANKIAVHSRGAIVELGTHDELMQIPNGHYRLLVEAQNRSKDDDLDEMEEMEPLRLPMLQQEIGWFDLEENASGALVSHLATDSATLQAMTSDTLNQGLVNLTTLGIGFCIAFYYSWEMTLLLLATSPILAFTSYIQAQMMSGTINNRKNNDADTAAGSMLSEAIGSIRTVASFSMEKALNSAITFEDMFMVIIVIMLSMFAVGMAAQNMTDQAKAKKAASRIFSIIDRVPEIDSTSTNGDKLPQVHGDIHFKGVAFAYPSRPDAQIYKNYSLSIASGQTVALVGASGSGKSTAISLLERFYDPASGVVTLDGTDLRKLSLPWLRERISLVSQEPVLFAGTIAENIAMGKPGATREEVMEAAKKANAFDFISNFPNGFDTDLMALPNGVYKALVARQMGAH